MVNLLLATPGASAWVRDLQGRTALHCAAETLQAGLGPENENYNYDTMKVLRTSMAKERPQQDPIGVNAPVDLSGRTPLGRQKRTKKELSPLPSQEVRDLLFCPGDKSVLPIQPYGPARMGVSPVKPPPPPQLLHSPNGAVGAAGGVVPGSPAALAGEMDGGASASLPSPVPYLKYRDDEAEAGAEGEGELETPRESFVSAVPVSATSTSQMPPAAPPQPPQQVLQHRASVAYDVYASSTAGGWKSYMEDRVLIAVSTPHAVDADDSAGNDALTAPSPFDSKGWNIYAVCDGHGGTFCAQYLVDHFPRIIASTAEKAHLLNTHSPTASPDDLCAVLVEAFASMEQELMQNPRMEVETKTVQGTTHNLETGQPKSAKTLDGSGSTCVLCLTTPTFYAIANVGDSRALVAQYANVEDTVRCAWSTEDHKVSNPIEKERIIAAGLDASNNSCVLGNTTLNMSRSFGDFIFKQHNTLPLERQAVIALPDISVFPRTAVDKFAVIACDGVFDVMSNEEIVSFFTQRLYAFGDGGGAGSGRSIYSEPNTSRQATAAAACDELLSECLQRGSCDNMSIVIIVF